MKRREFIGMVAVGVAGAVLPVAARDGNSVATALARPKLLEIVHDDRIVLELGRRYREVAPTEDNAETLMNAIAVEPSSFAAAPPEAAALREQVDAQVLRDFAAGRTVTLHGWILSVTEARQCALFSLLPA
jgi:hypothetical protein